MDGDRTIVLDVMLHEHLIDLKLLQRRDVVLGPAFRHLDREFDDLGRAGIPILADFREYRIAQFFADLGQRIVAADPDTSDIIRSMVVVNTAGDHRKQAQRPFRLDGCDQQRFLLS